MAAEVAFLEARCQHRQRDLAIGIDAQRRKVTEVAITVGALVGTGLFWIEVATCRGGGDGLAILLGRFAAGIGMQVEAVNAALEPLDLRRQQQTIIGILGHDTADGLTDAITADAMHFHLGGGLGDAAEQPGAERHRRGGLEGLSGRGRKGCRVLCLVIHEQSLHH